MNEDSQQTQDSENLKSYEQLRKENEEVYQQLILLQMTQENQNDGIFRTRILNAIGQLTQELTEATENLKFIKDNIGVLARMYKRDLESKGVKLQ